MDNRTFLDIIEGYDNVQFLQYPNFMHFWFDENDKIISKPCSVGFLRFQSKESFINYMDDEKEKGHTVYFMEGKHPITYDPRDFSPIINIRMLSVFGSLKRVKEYQLKESNPNHYQYLLIR